MSFLSAMNYFELCFFDFGFPMSYELSAMSYIELSAMSYELF